MNAVDYQVTGHRGAMDIEPENTMRSFRRAVEIGVDEIEFDVHLSQDGRPVVMHDDTLDRTTNGHGAIAEQSWAQLCVLDAALGERIPLLEDVLDEFDTVGLQIEVKAVAAARGVVEALQEREGSLGNVIITSFHLDALEAAVRPERFWALGLICGDNEQDKIARGCELGIDRLLLLWSVVDAPAAVEFRARGGAVAVWPCNDADSVRRAIAEGYAGGTSNDPLIAMRVRAEMRVDAEAAARASVRASVHNSV